MDNKTVKHYKYVGSSQIKDTVPKTSNRLHVTSIEAIMTWIKQSDQPKNPDDTVTVTFIIDIQSRLWINSQRSEHVHCAAGRDVLSAGEMTFELSHRHIELVDVTNQSTGYCPEPESWLSVVQALDKVEISHPDEFTCAYLFRRCDKCYMTNIIKDDWFYCTVCDSPLSQTWNYD